MSDVILSPERVRALARDLNSCISGKRQAAEKALRRLDPEHIPVLIEILTEENRARRTRKYALLGGAVALVVVFLLMGAKGPWWILFQGLGVSLAAASQLQRSGVRVLAEISDIRGVGVLSEALRSEDKEIRASAAQGLKRLLPRIKASDSSLFTERQRDALLHGLRQETAASVFRRDVRELGRSGLVVRDAGLAAAILQALGQVGDERHIPEVQRIAEAVPSNEQAARVCAEAQACLPLLKVRAEQAKASATLLRAASSDESNEILLRPAGAAPAEESETLLRPTL